MGEIDLLTCTLQGALLILCGLIIRRTRLPRFGAEAFYALACLRLLIPFRLYSPWGLPSLPGTNTAIVVYNSPAEAHIITTSQAYPWLNKVLVCLWLTGMVVTFGYFLFRMLRTHRVLAAALPLNRPDLKRLLSPRLNVRLRYSDQIDSPCVWGAIHPQIVLPASLARESVSLLQPVLAHEQAHIQRFDLLRKCMLLACLSLHWFNPLVWLMWFFASRDMEMMCDQKAITSMSKRERAAYAMSLLSFEERRLSLAALCFSRRAAKERLKAVMKETSTSKLGILLCTALVFTASVALGTSAPVEILVETASFKEDHQSILIDSTVATYNMVSISKDDDYSFKLSSMSAPEPDPTQMPAIATYAMQVVSPVVIDKAGMVSQVMSFEFVE